MTEKPIALLVLIMNIPLKIMIAVGWVDVQELQVILFSVNKGTKHPKMAFMLLKVNEEL